MRKLLVILTILIVAAGCKSESVKMVNEILTKMESKDTLVVKAHFTECGEWGGHHETYKIFRYKNQYKYNCIIDTVDCSLPPYFNRRVHEESLYKEVSRADLIIFLNKMNEGIEEDYVINHADPYYLVYCISDTNRQYHNPIEGNWELFTEFRERQK